MSTWNRDLGAAPKWHYCVLRRGICRSRVTSEKHRISIRRQTEVEPARQANQALVVCEPALDDIVEGKHPPCVLGRPVVDENRAAICSHTESCVPAHIYGVAILSKTSRSNVKGNANQCLYRRDRRTRRHPECVRSRSRCYSGAQDGRKRRMPFAASVRQNPLSGIIRSMRVNKALRVGDRSHARYGTCRSFDA